MSCIFATTGLDSRQGGVQVSAIDALRAAPHSTRSIVLGTDPERLTQPTCVVQSLRSKLIVHTLLKNWACDRAVFWHLSMLKLLPLLKLKGFRGKKILFLHGIEAWRIQSPATRRKLASVDLFLSNSQFTWDRFLEFSPELRHKPHLVTPLGYGEPLNVIGGYEQPKSPSALIVARMAKMEDYKGHRQLINAWPSILVSHPTAVLHVVGEGDLTPELVALTRKLNLNKSVTFHGRIDEATKESLLKQCSLFAMPSQGEGFGIVYLEAMRMGRPCIVSDRDAGREVVNPPEAGIAVKPDNPLELSNAIIKLLSSVTIWKKMSDHAIRRYESIYTESAFQERIWASIRSA
ncbi:MAG: glycosyltransferase family 4 protein [Pirellula sp.]|jgi:phosphatidylinositol alpha-1,6-mannosyltransferase